MLHNLKCFTKRLGLIWRFQLLYYSDLFDHGYFGKLVRSKFGVRSFLVLKYLLDKRSWSESPSEYFSGGWYLERYEDVKTLGHNPLVHFLLHGHNEGRLPYFGAKLISPQKYQVSFRYQLYHGFEHRALQYDMSKLPECDYLWMVTWLLVHGQSEEGKRLLKLCHGKQSFAFQVAFLKLGMASEVNEYDYFLEGVMSLRYTSLVNGCMNASGLNDIYSRHSLVHLREWSTLNRLSSFDAPLIVRNFTTVVMPARNAEKTISYALKSVLAQSCSNLEIIVVDDASQDGTLALVEEIARTDTRVHVLANSIPLGAYASRNIGMKAAKGEFVTVHDADDWSHPQKLEKQMQPLLESPDVVATFSDWVRVTEDMEIVGPWMLNAEFVEKNHSSLLLRASVLEQTGLWDEVRVAADTEYLWRLEHHFGHKAIVSVLPKVPLSFALSANTTLTQASATHVKTTMYGLRRIYRESSQWWHRKEGFKPVLHDGDRPFPLPLGMLKKLPQVDHVIAGDLTDESRAFKKQLKAVVSCCVEQYGANICFLHLPQCSSWHLLAIGDHVFETAHEQGFSFANPGISLPNTEVTLLNNVKLTECPTSIAKFPELREIHGKVDSSRTFWLEYFRTGLHPDSKSVPYLSEVYGAD